MDLKKSPPLKEKLSKDRPRKLGVLSVYVAYPDKKIATQITKALLRNKLIACANVFPKMESHYIWQNRIVQEFEIAVLYKTTTKNWLALEQAILKLHPYECPCIMATQASAVTPRYAAWVIGSTSL